MIIAGQGGREGGREGWKRERKWERERGGGGEIREREGDRAWDNIVQCVYCARAVCSYVILNYIISWKLWFTSLHVCSLTQAKTRVKLNFLDNLAKFWELQVSVYVYITCIYVWVYVYATNLPVTFTSASIESLVLLLYRSIHSVKLATWMNVRAQHIPSLRVNAQPATSSTLKPVLTMVTGHASPYCSQVGRHSTYHVLLW